jgi:hypothetical protein
MRYDSKIQMSVDGVNDFGELRADSMHEIDCAILGQGKRKKSDDKGSWFAYIT